jgi:hypothetical protein
MDSPHSVRRRPCSHRFRQALAARRCIAAFGAAVPAAVPHAPGAAFLGLLFAFSVLARPARAQDSQPQLPESNPPAATLPAPAVTVAPQQPNSCDVKNAGGSMAATVAAQAAAVLSAGASPVPAPKVVNIVLCVPHLPIPIVNWYARFLNGPQVKPLTPLEKAHLAGRNLVDPFNIMTISAEAAISVAINSHSVYGPGFDGWGKYAGVSFTQDMVGEFFGTFLIPSIVHQDPHYHRMPNASIKRRIFHCIDQIAWTQGDNGAGMVNYADLVGFALEDGVNDLYVPGQQTNFRASAARYGTTLGTAPVDNFITEFLPDIASHIHVRVVLVQRIINQVARTGAPTQ